VQDHRNDPLEGELRRDARAIAEQLFGATVDELEDLYRQAYLRNDREWLLQQARRDPDLFLVITKRIGVQMPTVAVDPPPRLTDSTVQQTHTVAPIEPPRAGPEPIGDAALTPVQRQSAKPRARAPGDPGAKLKRNAGWRRAMEESDALMKRGLSRMVALHELAADGEIAYRWATDSLRTINNWERWWSEVRPPAS
jgi:hypothetical protein